MYEPLEEEHAFLVRLKYVGIADTDVGYLSNLVVPKPTVERVGDAYVFTARVTATDFLPAINIVLQFVNGIPMKRLRVANALVEVSAQLADD